MAATNLGAVLNALLSPDNAARNAAEAAYNQALEGQLPSVAQGLLQTVRSAPDEVHRTLAAVLIRRAIGPFSGRWQKLDAATQRAVQTELLAALAAETRPHLARKLCLAAAGLTSSDGGSAWPELVQFAVTAAQAPAEQPLRREVGYLLLGKIGEFNFEMLAPHMAPLQPLLLAGIGGAGESAAGRSMQLEALRAGVSLVLSLPGLAQQQPLAESLLPGALAAIAAALASDELHARELLQALVDLATHAARAFGGQLGATVSAMLQVAGYAELEAATRTTAIELLVTLCEQAASVVRADPAAVQATVGALMTSMAEVEADERAWTATAYIAADKNDEFDEEEEVAVAAEEALERTVSALGAAATRPCFALIEQQAQSPDWRVRRAALN
eukprot:g8231.t1